MRRWWCWWEGLCSVFSCCSLVGCDGSLGLPQVRLLALSKPGKSHHPHGLRLALRIERGHLLCGVTAPQGDLAQVWATCSLPRCAQRKLAWALRAGAQAQGLLSGWVLDTPRASLGWSMLPFLEAGRRGKLLPGSTPLWLGDPSSHELFRAQGDQYLFFGPGWVSWAVWPHGPREVVAAPLCSVKCFVGYLFFVFLFSWSSARICSLYSCSMVVFYLFFPAPLPPTPQ